MLPPPDRPRTMRDLILQWLAAHDHPVPPRNFGYPKRRPVPGRIYKTKPPRYS